MSNRPERQFCHACASPLVPAACPACDFVNYPGERFCGGCGTDTGRPAPRSVSRSTSELVSVSGAERRQVTVLFCDMVGSTALSAELDAEVLRDVIKRFQEACAAQVALCDGFIARYMGDGMLVYFGYPRAHEDSAQRAVRAGLGIVEAVSALRGLPVRPQVRVGIATGRVVVGDIIGEGASEERAMVGETPNLAARLQGLAAPDTVVISGRTRRLTGDAFAVEDLGTHELKGFPEPVQAWRATGLKQGTRVRGADVPLQGRTLEFTLMKEQWASAADGSGGAVLLTGDPGTGKSRLIRELAEHARLQTEGSRILNLRCAQYQREFVLHPIVEFVTASAGIELGDDHVTRLRKIDAFVSEWSSDEADRKAFRTLLSLAVDEAATPEERRRLMLQGVVRFLLHQCDSTPLLIALDDAQWADLATHELVGRLTEESARRPLMVLTAQRSGFEAPWAASAGLTVLSLPRLREAEARALVRAAAAPAELSDSVTEVILRRGDGVPEFLVELTRVVLARGASDAEAGSSAVPETLQDSLAAQLDGLGGARALANVAAVIGRDFSHDLLARVVGASVAALTSDIDALTAAGVFVRTPSGLAFRHALLRELAFESLLRSDRRRLHDRVASVLLDELPDAAAADPAAVAHHLEEAGRGREAAGWWAKAATRASQQAAFTESAAHWRRAISSLEPEVDPTSADDCEALAEMMVELALKLRVLAGSEEAFAVLERAEAALAPHDRLASLAHVYFARGNLHFNLGDAAACTRAHERGLELAEASGDARARVRALGGVTDATILTGDRVRAAELGEACVQAAMEAGFDAIAAGNAGSTAFAYFWANRLDDAERMARIAEECGLRAGTPRAVAVSCNAQVLIAIERADLATAETALRKRGELGGGDQVMTNLLFADFRVYQLRGREREGHEYLAAQLAATERSPVIWHRVFRVCLLAGCPDDELEERLAAVYAGLDNISRNIMFWIAEGIVESMIRRRDWVRLDQAIEYFGDLDTSRIPRAGTWLDAGKAVAAWVKAPADPDRVAAVRGLLEFAQGLPMWTLERTLREVLGEVA